MHKFLPVLLLQLAVRVSAQNIDFVKAEQLTRWKTADTDTVYVLNFWATWCAPCVAELPEFEKLNDVYAGKNVQVILVDNDFRRDLDKRVYPFIKEKNLKCRVAFVDERTPNDWINLVSTDWSGALPATLIVNKHRNFERFYEEPLSFEVLEQAVEEALHQN